jgi:DNA polymerase-3 subunit alpha
LPLDNAKAYELLNKGNTLGVFQLESGGMRDLCRKFQISSVEHITALIALYRPGPMELIPEFIKRRHGEVKIEYEHPLLEPICRETYGILVYQEQVMQAAQVLAGYTLGGADLLRRAMGKKKAEEMAKQREIFVKGCADGEQYPGGHGQSDFSIYSKNSPDTGLTNHTPPPYAIVAYQTAYLKANYPVEFLCAMMTNDMSSTEKLAQYINEAHQFGIEVMPPDVNESRVAFTPARGGEVIRFGLAAIKGVGEVAVESILEAREEGGKFNSLSHLCERVDTRTVNRKVLEALIKSGACDAFGETRASLFALIDHTLARAANNAHDRQRGQTSLFGMLEEKAVPTPETTARLPEWPQSELLAAEKDLLGFYVTGHPLTPYAPLLEKYSLANTTTLAQLPNRALTRIGGMVGAVQQGISKKNRQALRDGDVGGSRRLGAGAVHERKLRSVSGVLRTGQGNPGCRRSQQRRRQAEDFSAGDYAVGRTRRGGTPGKSICAFTSRTCHLSAWRPPARWSGRIRESVRSFFASFVRPAKFYLSKPTNGST